MHDNDHTEFDAWAAGLYRRDLTFWESAGALCFAALLLLLAILSPFAWLIGRIKNDFCGRNGAP